MKAVACGLALVCGSPAWAQEAPPSRPSEAEMFGGDEPRAEPAEPSPPAAPATEAARPSEDALFGNTAPASPNTPPRPAEDAQSAQAATNAFETGRGDPDDPLRIGGQFYLRTLAALDQRKKLDATQLSAPTIVDAYFDARPNERLRGMLLARLQYDPTLDPNRPSFLNSFSSGTALPGAGNAQGQGQTGGGNVNNNPNAATASTARNPALYLDQLWVRFDVARTAFFTVGRQHVKWGASRFWTPTDYLNYDFRDPLAPFDIRLGTNMIKVHL
ncbi:MAG TPA: hypothetical protein VEY30_12180, partial [Myxococcaceae bacterium]|nr:hypothetical protein [Myxococcaceae bacterium]